MRCLAHPASGVAGRGGRPAQLQRGTWDLEQPTLSSQRRWEATEGLEVALVSSFCASQTGLFSALGPSSAILCP